MKAPAPSPDSEIPKLLENETVLKHLDILQGIIGRLAGNASTCKNWCITLVSGAIVLSFSAELKVKPEVVFHLAYALIGIFLLLDSYYHALERFFRDQSNALVRSIHQGGFTPGKLLVIESHKGGWRTLGYTLRAAGTSLSTGGFYLILAATVFLTNWLSR
jgi:hypothetical protein